MPVLIPSFTTCRKHMTAGEQRVGVLLCKHLPEDCLLWYDIPVGGNKKRNRRYPDFIILHPRRGLVFLEVKDWRASSLARVDPLVCALKIRKNQRETLENHSNPLVQARQAAYAVVDQLKSIACLCQDGGIWQGRLTMPYGWGVAFSNITRADMRNLLGDSLEHIFPEHLLLYKDDLVENQNFDHFDERIWKMRNVEFVCDLQSQQINHIRAALFPEIVIKKQGPFILSKNEQREWLRLMDLEQERVARNIGEGHRVIHGVAGSGKTLILVLRAKLLAQVVDKPVLVICYTRALAAKLRSLFQEENGNISDNIEIIHFHAWCKNQCEQVGVYLPRGHPKPWEFWADSAITAVQQGVIANQQYGAVLMDEGHDFEADWLRILVQMVDENTQSLLFIYDSAQSIYSKKREKLKFPSLASVDIKAVGRTTILKTNYRNTQEIVRFARQLIEGHIDEIDGKEDLKPLGPLDIHADGIASGVVPVVKKFDSLEVEIVNLIRYLQVWNRRGTHWNAMSVIYPGGRAGLEMSKALQQAGIPFLHMFDANTKSLYNPHKNELPLLTIHSCKGLEFPSVVVLDASFVSSEREDDFSLSMRLLYVAATRAREVLLMSFHRDNAVADALLQAASVR